jgi:hypothetical protein
MRVLWRRIEHKTHKRGDGLRRRMEVFAVRSRRVHGYDSLANDLSMTRPQPGDR